MTKGDAGAARRALIKQIEKHQTELRDINNLTPYPMNSRKHEDWQIALLAGAMKEFGFTQPCIVDEDDVILGGHARVMAALKLDLKKIPCIVMRGLTRAQKRALVIWDNKSSEAGSSWDREMQGMELKELREEGFDTKLIGFSEIDIEKLGVSSPQTNTEPATEAPKFQHKCPECGHEFNSRKKRSS